MPFPGSTDPREVLENIGELSRQNHLAAALHVPELDAPQRTMKVRRVLEVRSDKPAPRYLMIELNAVDGRPLLNLAMTPDGALMGVEDLRSALQAIARSVDLAIARSSVRRRRGREPEAAEHVFFSNAAEQGSSPFRPLAAVVTERGTIYLNSSGEAFVESGSLLRDEFSGGRGLRALPASAGTIQLYQIMDW